MEDVRLQFDSQLVLEDWDDPDTPCYLFKFTDFEAIPEKTFAEQLTYIDSVSDL